MTKTEEKKDAEHNPLAPGAKAQDTVSAQDAKNAPDNPSGPAKQDEGKEKLLRKELHELDFNKATATRNLDNIFDRVIKEICDNLSPGKLRSEVEQTLREAQEKVVCEIQKGSN